MFKLSRLNKNLRSLSIIELLQFVWYLSHLAPNVGPDFKYFVSRGTFPVSFFNGGTRCAGHMVISRHNRNVSLSALTRRC